MNHAAILAPIVERYLNSSGRDAERIEGEIFLVFEAYLPRVARKHFEHVSEDMLQEGLLSAVRAARRFQRDGGADFLTFLTANAIAAMKNESRQRSDYPAYLLEDAEQLAKVEAQYTDDETLMETEKLDSKTLVLLRQVRAGSAPLEKEVPAHRDDQELEIDVARAFATLPEDLVDLARMVLLEEVDPTEAALLLGLHPQTASQKLKQARKILKEALEDGG